MINMKNIITSNDIKKEKAQLAPAVHISAHRSGGRGRFDSFARSASPLFLRRKYYVRMRGFCPGGSAS